jgi:tetratricopeptide (TPR) repeat protein
MKKILAISLVLMTTACSVERSNQIDDEFNSLGYGSDENGSEGKGPDSDISYAELKQRNLIAELAKKNHGLMHVHRHGPGFDVLMTLDAGDSDVSFSMKIPQENKNIFDEQDFASVGDTNAAIMSQLDDETADLHHQELEKRVTATEDKKLAYYKASIKHIFNAQSLFYKKNFTKALDQTNKALALVPESAQAHALRGSIYYKMGLTEEAQVSWKEALAIDPSMEQVSTSLARLNKEFNL